MTGFVQTVKFLTGVSHVRPDVALEGAASAIACEAIDHAKTPPACLRAGFLSDVIVDEGDDLSFAGLAATYSSAS